MAKLTKNRKISIEKVDSDKSYSLEEASSLVKEICKMGGDVSEFVDPISLSELKRKYG